MPSFRSIVNMGSVHLILSFVGSISPTPFSKVFSGCRRGRTPERSLRQPPTFPKEPRAGRPGLNVVPVHAAMRRAGMKVAHQPGVLYVGPGSYPVRYQSTGCGSQGRNDGAVDPGEPRCSDLDGLSEFSRPTGAGGPLPPRTPTRGGPADPHLPGFRLSARCVGARSRSQALTFSVACEFRLSTPVQAAPRSPDARGRFSR